MVISSYRERSSHQNSAELVKRARLRETLIKEDSNRVPLKFSLQGLVKSGEDEGRTQPVVVTTPF